jgi:ATP-binding protein involved in chromosome partitioning
MDPRPAVIGARLRSVSTVLAVAAGKGGVGKSTVATCLALALRDRGHAVGLMDLDFHGPSTHLILGANAERFTEDKGIVPPIVHGLEYLSIVQLAGERPAPLRGLDVSNALLELLAITRWGALDALVLDMPPGIGDATLDLLRVLGRARVLLVTTPSRVAQEVVARLGALLIESGAPALGFVENMVGPAGASRAPALESLGLRRLGELPFDAGLEAATGDVARIRETAFAHAIADLAPQILAFARGS